MPFPRFPLVVAAAALVAVVSAGAAEATERLSASFFLALGRAPTTAELRDWEPYAGDRMADLFARHRRQLAASESERRGVANRAWRDALGGEPGAHDADPLAAENGTYAEQVERLRRTLVERDEQYRAVLDRAYRRVIGRGPFVEELDYWRQHAALPYAALVGCLENWARRNAPGLTVTSGVPAICVNSGFLTTLRLSPTVAAEVRAAAGLSPAGDPALALARGHNVVMPGAAEAVSVGGVHFAAIGAAQPAAQ